MPMIYRCGGCGVDKPADQFYTNSTRKNGLSYWCRVCTMEYSARKHEEKRRLQQEKMERKEAARASLESAKSEQADVSASESAPRVDEKQCSQCLRVKPLSEFALSSKGAYGRSAYCRDCDWIRKRYGKAGEPKAPASLEDASGNFKVCSACGRILHVDEFCLKSSNSDGLNTRCRRCKSIDVEACRKRIPNTAVVRPKDTPERSIPVADMLRSGRLVACPSCRRIVLPEEISGERCPACSSGGCVPGCESHDVPVCIPEPLPQVMNFETSERIYREERLEKRVRKKKPVFMECPFCGRVPRLTRNVVCSIRTVSLNCDCTKRDGGYVDFTFDNEYDAADFWNRRSPAKKEISK